MAAATVTAAIPAKAVRGKSQGKSASAKAKASTQVATTASTKAAKKAATKAAVEQQVASLPKEKNLNAKLGRLNSLNRNINAYLNSKSAKFAAIQAFVTASAEFDLAQAELEAAIAAAANAQITIDSLNAELSALQGLPPAATPEEQAAREAEIAELNAQIAEQQALLDAVTAAEAAAAAAAEGTDDTALEAALKAMANKPVDEEVMDWAKEVLGVGEQSARSTK